MNKGVAPSVMALLVVFGLIAAGTTGYFLLQVIKPPKPPVKLTGELEDTFLPTEGWFAPELTEYVDANITDNILNKNYQAGIYRTDVALNDTANPYIAGRKMEHSVALEVDGPVKAEIEGYLADGVENVSLKKFEIYTHGDEPSKISELTVEDQSEVEEVVSLPRSGEYVFYIINEPQSGVNMATGDDLMKVDIDLQNTEPGVDVDEGHFLIESS